MGLSVKPIVALLFASGVPVNRHQLHAYTSDRIFGSRSNSSFWKLGSGSGELDFTPNFSRACFALS
jgi:hypothetical protein